MGIESWIRTKRKEARLKGESYRNTSKKDVKKRKMGPPCNCKKNCFEKVPLKAREVAFNEYYSLPSYEAQSKYLYNLMDIMPTRSRKFGATKRIDRLVHYFILDGENRTKICLRAFMSIFAITRSRVAQIHLLETREDFNDYRGKVNKPNHKVPTAEDISDVQRFIKKKLEENCSFNSIHGALASYQHLAMAYNKYKDTNRIIVNAHHMKCIYYDFLGNTTWKEALEKHSKGELKFFNEQKTNTVRRACKKDKDNSEVFEIHNFVSEPPKQEEADEARSSAKAVEYSKSDKKNSEKHKKKKRPDLNNDETAEKSVGQKKHKDSVNADKIKTESLQDVEEAVEDRSDCMVERSQFWKKSGFTDKNAAASTTSKEVDFQKRRKKKHLVLDSVEEEINEENESETVEQHSPKRKKKKKDVDVKMYEEEIIGNHFEDLINCAGEISKHRDKAGTSVVGDKIADEGKNLSHKHKNNKRAVFDEEKSRLLEVVENESDSEEHRQHSTKRKKKKKYMDAKMSEEEIMDNHIEDRDRIDCVGEISKHWGKDGTSVVKDKIIVESKDILRKHSEKRKNKKHVVFDAEESSFEVVESESGEYRQHSTKRKKKKKALDVEKFEDELMEIHCEDIDRSDCVDEIPKHRDQTGISVISEGKNLSPKRKKKKRVVFDVEESFEVVEKERDCEEHRQHSTKRKKKKKALDVEESERKLDNPTADTARIHGSCEISKDWDKVGTSVVSDKIAVEGKNLSEKGSKYRHKHAVFHEESRLEVVEKESEKHRQYSPKHKKKKKAFDVENSIKEVIEDRDRIDGVGEISKHSDKAVTSELSDQIAVTSTDLLETHKRVVFDADESRLEFVKKESDREEHRQHSPKRKKKKKCSNECLSGMDESMVNTNVNGKITNKLFELRFNGCSNSISGDNEVKDKSDRSPKRYKHKSNSDLNIEENSGNNGVGGDSFRENYSPKRKKRKHAEVDADEIGIDNEKERDPVEYSPKLKKHKKYSERENFSLDQLQPSFDESFKVKENSFMNGSFSDCSVKKHKKKKHGNVERYGSVDDSTEVSTKIKKSKKASIDENENVDFEGVNTAQQISPKLKKKKHGNDERCVDNSTEQVSAKIKKSKNASMDENVDFEGVNTSEQIYPKHKKKKKSDIENKRYVDQNERNQEGLSTKRKKKKQNNLESIFEVPEEANEELQRVCKGLKEMQNGNSGLGSAVEGKESTRKKKKRAQYESDFEDKSIFLKELALNKKNENAVEDSPKKRKKKKAELAKEENIPS